MTDQSESLFWDKYISKTKAYRIKATAARWYVRHAERYIKAHANLRLAQHSVSQMEKYIREKGRNSYLEDWQYKQMIVALRILFIEMVKVPWARDFAWDDWLVAADSLPNSHATVARDYQPIEINRNEALDSTTSDNDSALYKQVFKQYPEHIRAFIAQIFVCGTILFVLKERIWAGSCAISVFTLCRTRLNFQNIISQVIWNIWQSNAKLPVALKVRRSMH